MMIIRLPQQGQGCFAVFCSSALVPGSSALVLAANRNYWCQREQFAGARDVRGTLTAVEHSIIADAVETCGQHMHQETADELVGRERHRLVTLGAFDPVVLPFEGDPLLIACDQSPVGDGDPVGIAGEIAKDFLGPAKWALAVDDPFAFAQWRQIGREGFRVGQPGMLTEELQLPGFVSDGELVEEQSPEQSRQHAYRQEEVKSAFSSCGRARSRR